MFAFARCEGKFDFDTLEALSKSTRGVVEWLAGERWIWTGEERILSHVADYLPELTVCCQSVKSLHEIRLAKFRTCDKRHLSLSVSESRHDILT